MSGSSEDMIRGVAFSVPHVMSCCTAEGPSSDGVGEGTLGTKEKLLFVGERGRSGHSNESIVQMTYYVHVHGVPAIAALILLRVGLGGSDTEEEEFECS